MGIDFSHCDSHWSYYGFHWFRVRLAKEIGIDLEKMEGFEDLRSMSTGSFEKGMSWKGIKDPIKCLLNHSDCDGRISAKKCAVIYPRLLELIKDWPDDDYDKKQALELAEGMKEAAESNQALMFW